MQHRTFHLERTTMKHHLQLPHTHTFGSQTFLNSKEVKEQRSCLVQCVLQGLGLNYREVRALQQLVLQFRAFQVATLMCTQSSTLTLHTLSLHSASGKKCENACSEPF
mmetsp:Transcript_46722/g.107239  ORF Transcript_46722/g.107239 Transcript_46722/m.107239 type:complete len:108 (-) Transcript_46722:815-1138(-)